ncbi:spindle and centriole-associated protein 1 isoform X2 [Nerophis ophidion]|uniref:spindle and centriole-associated protein 1 isoform X2 n=1 Tax=Nerophis ophidion TaxID=159077 RepID=UPI002ADFD85B|nr:spindle and centriole-associated protein 1 isoform X2 [Nerophis ophidion]
MSLVRGGGRPQQNKAKKAVVRSKKSNPPKREWLSTVNDLSVYKLSPAELNHRHELRKSHNKAAAQWELREKALQGRLVKQTGSSPAPLDQSSLTILREQVFSDKLLLQDALARSDRAMALVQKLFGDAPRRQTGHACVTMVPNCDSPPTRLSLFDESMVEQQALSEQEDKDDTSTATLIQRKMKAKNKVQRQKVCRQRFSSPGSPCMSASTPAQTALNATLAVQRLRSQQNQSQEGQGEPSFLVSQVLNPELSPKQAGSCRTARTRKRVCKTVELNGSSVASLSKEHSSLGLLQTMLGQVEGALDRLSPDVGPAWSQTQQTTHGFTGFSVALVSTLGRLVHILKKHQEESESAVEERRRLEEKLREQRELIDALSAESMTLREEATSLQQRTTELERKLESVVSTSQCSDVIATVQQPVGERPLISLSPVCRRDSWCPLPDSHPGPSHQDANDKLSAQNSSLLSSLSLTSDPLLSLEAMEAEIAKLCRLKDVIRAQLSQARAGGLFDSSGQQRSLSSISTSRATPHIVSNRITESASTTQQSMLASNTLSVQQRLLEVNQQSAAARARLLELIEQQKQNISTKGSPSDYFIPSSAFSPQPAGGASADQSFLMRADKSLSGADRRTSACEVYSQHYEEAQRDGSTQGDKRGVQEGWFALAAHPK